MSLLVENSERLPDLVLDLSVLDLPRQADRPVKQIRMKFALLISALVASTFAAPKATNDLTCTICVDVITDLDNFITDATTEDQIVAFFKEICHSLGSIMGSSTLEAECNAMFENNLPQIIDDLVNQNLDPMTICTTIGACPCSRTTFPRSLTTSSTRILIP